MHPDRLAITVRSVEDVEVLRLEQVRGGVEPYDLLRAVASLYTPGHDVGPDHARRMVDLLIDGLRYGAVAP
jgi:hypothetical protein